jgi:predicted small metal-binding protein
MPPILRMVIGSEPVKQFVVRCECGWETRGTEEQIVPVLQKHADESHNMKVTREQVIARAQPI